MRKRFLKQAGAAVLCTSVLLSGCGQSGQQASATTAKAETSAEAAGKYIPGTYTGEADGFGGVLKVEVTVDANAVTSITVTEQSETDGVGSKAIEALPDAIVKANSVEVDDISGATVSSGAIKAAVKAALAQAAGESGAAAELALTDGTYQAETQGNNGPIQVSVTVADGKVSNVEITDHQETEGIYNVPFEVIPKQVVEYQSLGVDSVSGATVSSNALKAAIADCIGQAGGDAEAFARVEIPKKEKTEEEFTYDVVVVGGGLSGLTAACSAAGQGAKVALIEKQAFLGGTTMLATGTIRYADEGDGAGMVQAILDEGADFREEGDAFPIVDYLDAIGEVSYKSTAIYNEAGLNMLPESGDGARPYVQKPDTDGKAGGLYIQKLEPHLEKLGGTIYKSTPATSLIQDEDGTVTGVISDTETSKKTFHAGAVILACGDFARNQDLIKEYNPISTGNFTGTAVGNTGDGLVMAVDAGAALWDDMFSMGGAFVFNPYDSHRAGMKASETLDNSLFVSLDGKRRIKENASSKFVHAVFKNENEADSCWDIMDAEIVKGTESPIDEMIAGNGGARIALKADTIEELAELAGIEPDILKATVDRYNELCEAGEDKDFGKNAELMVPIKTAPFYAVRAYCVTRGIAGGVKTTTAAEVVREDGSVIPGLYASGAIASRPFYGGAYQGAAALSVAGNMGCIAGENAAKAVLNK